MRLHDCVLACVGAAALVGCDELPECSSLPVPPKLWACMVKLGDSPTEARLTYSITGSVTAVGPAIEGGCLPAVGDTLSASRTTVLTLAGADGASYDLEYLAPPGSGPVWAVGDDVAAEYSYVWGGWSPTKTNLAVTRAGRLELYYGGGGDVRDFTSSPLALGQGKARCEGHDECGSWRYYDLQVVASTGAVDVPYGESRAVDDYNVIHGGVGRSVTSTTCNDWSVAFASAAVLRRPAP